MPDLSGLGIPLYQPLFPYHYSFDNLPLAVLGLRDEVLNDQIDIDAQTLRNAAGTAGSLDNRLDQSINADGSLEASAIDEALHNIGAHTDGTFNSVAYVRMLLTERNKLSLIANDATNMPIQIDSTLISQGPVIFNDSESVTWELGAGNNVEAHLTFSVDLIVQHFYTQIPLPQTTPDFQHYKINSLSTPYIAGSLRVYVNGARLVSSPHSIYVPGATPSDSWVLVTYTENSSGGTFALSRALTSADTVYIDYDLPT